MASERVKRRTASLAVYSYVCKYFYKNIHGTRFGYGYVENKNKKEEKYSQVKKSRNERWGG